MPYSEVDILNYIENRLTEQERIAFENSMDSDGELKELVEAMQASFLPYDEAITHSECNEKAPESLYNYLDDVSRAIYESGNAERSGRKKVSFFSLAKVAGFAVALFAAGYLSSSIIETKQPYQELLSSFDVSSDLVESMITYQALYDRNTVENASQSAADTQRVLAEFNNANTLTLSVPDLSQFGYQFRRAQQLAFNGKPIMQFVYIDASGEPVAVCVTPANTSEKALTQMATKYADMNTVLWGHAGSAYMLISKEPKERVDQMAKNLLSKQI